MISHAIVCEFAHARFSSCLLQQCQGLRPFPVLHDAREDFTVDGRELRQFCAGDVFVPWFATGAIFGVEHQQMIPRPFRIKAFVRGRSVPRADHVLSANEVVDFRNSRGIHAKRFKYAEVNERLDEE